MPPTNSTKSRLPRVGILYSPRFEEKSFTSLRNNLTRYANITLLDCRDNRIVDIVMLPNGGGLYSGLQCFGAKMIPSVSCPEVEYWRLHGLSYYLEKNIPIIGIGDGAALLWNEYSGKVEIINNVIELIPENLRGVRIIKEDGLFVTKFETSRVHGFKTFCTEVIHLVQDITKVINEPENDDHEAKIFCLP